MVTTEKKKKKKTRDGTYYDCLMIFVDLESLAVWEERERRIKLLIVTRLIQEGDNSLAIELLDESIKLNQDPLLMSALGRVQLTVCRVVCSTLSNK
jgi:hypothetical protein